MTPEQRARAWYPKSSIGGGNYDKKTKKPLPASGVFLWKPTSDSDGNAAIHTPANVRVSSITVAGKTYGVGAYGNGWRPLFRMDKPGSAYGKGIPVQFNLHGGGVLAIIVPDGSKRFEKSGFRDTDSGPVTPPVPPKPPSNDPIFRVTDSGIVFSADIAPLIEQVYVVECVNSKGQAKYVHRCRKVNALAWAPEFTFSLFEKPAFYAVDVADRIEHLIPHSVRGWVYVNAKGQIVRFGAQPLPPAVPIHPPAPPNPPAPEPEPGPLPLYTRTETSLTLRQDLADACRYVDAVANNSHANGNKDHIRLIPVRTGNTWTLPRPLADYPRGQMPNTWRLALAKGKTFPAGVTYHTSISQTFIQTTTPAGKFYPPTTRA